MRAGEQPVGRRGGEQPGEALLGGQVDRGRPPTQVPVRDVRPLAAAELLAGLPQQDDHVAVAVEPRPHPPRDVLDHAEHAHHRRRQDRAVAGLVVEADVAAGDGDAQAGAAVGEPAHGLARTAT